jgi:hypothetical protein
METKHTLTPWKVANNKGMDFPMIVTPEKEQPKYAIAEVYPTSGQFDEKNDFFALGNALENAAFIVLAVNAYEKDQEIKKELLEALQAIGALPDGYCFCPEGRGGGEVNNFGNAHTGECEDARNAIAKAEGE